MEVEAIYQQGGTLKLARELPLEDGEKVRLIIRQGESRAQKSQGLVPWQGSSEDLRTFARTRQPSLG